MVLVEIVEKIRQAAEEDTAKTITEEGWLASAKDQNFGAFFARDALNCSKFRLYTFERYPTRYELLAPVQSSLRTMARHQGRACDPRRDEEFGKILHELRYYDTPKNTEWLGELQLGGWPVDKEGLKYFGSADSTSLFVSVSCEYFLLTDDFQFFQELDLHIRNALHWMGNHVDALGDGYIRFAAKNRNALLNQGWKDSFDSIEIAPNRRPKEPIALVEIQGYAYEAYLKAAEAYRRIGDFEFAKELYQKAGTLKTRFNHDFWMEDEGFFAYALEGNNNQVREITSNVGHLLLTGIIEDEKIPVVVRRLMQPDIFTQWGIRTLSLNSPLFSDREPSAYHRGGSVWPHDNAIAYLGFKKTGFYREAGLVRDAVLLAGYTLFVKYGSTDDELYMVERSGKLRPYETAQHPQSWVGEAHKMWTDPLEV